MLRDTRELLGYSIRAKDGTIGHVSDFYFDERTWMIRYLVVDTGKWLMRHPVVLLAGIVEGVDHEKEELAVPVTREQVKNSPNAESATVLSREAELLLMKYWNWAPVWLAPTEAPVIEVNMKLEASQDELEVAEAAAESRLRSLKEIVGYKAIAENGYLGSVQGLACDEKWDSRYLLVATENWTPDRTIYVPCRDIADVSWSHEEVRVSVHIEDLRQAPSVDPSNILERMHSGELSGAFGVSAYQHSE